MIRGDEMERRAHGTYGGRASPGRGLLSAALAGLGVAVVGFVIGYMPSRSPWALHAGAYLAACVTAWVMTFRLGGSPGSATALGFLALPLVFVLDSLLEYVLLLGFTMAPYIGADNSDMATVHMEALLWKFYFLVSFLNILVGAVLGLMLGRPRMPPRV